VTDVVLPFFFFKSKSQAAESFFLQFWSF